MEKVFQQLQKHLISTVVGILLDRGLDKRITHVLCPVGFEWTNEASEIIVEYATKMAKTPTVSVTVMRMVTSDFSDNIQEANKLNEICGEDSSMKFITRKTENVVSTLMEETNGGKYTLLVVPFSLLSTSKEVEEAILSISSCSVLAIHINPNNRVEDLGIEVDNLKDMAVVV